MSAAGPAPPARLRASRFSLVWVLPLVAVALGAYLAYRTVRDQGPLITISFRTGTGLVAGQTKVRHKAVELGTVESIRLGPDMQSVLVEVRMQHDAARYLTESARFWVVRARLSAGSISGIETLLSGSFIEMDPGSPQGERKLHFVGLDEPPGVRSGEPGHTYVLKARRLGSLGPGTPVFWRDIVVGEVLGYDVGDGTGPVMVRVFVRAPYDGFVRHGSNFWNVSGLSVQTGPEGVHIEVASLQALLAGGVAFSTPPQGAGRSAPMPENAVFTLYRDYAAAQAAGYSARIPAISYFDSSVRGLATDSPVEFLGIQVGVVNDVQLRVSPDGRSQVRVVYEIQPQRLSREPVLPDTDPIALARALVTRGMRAQLRTASFLTGSMVLALDFVPSAPPLPLEVEAGAPVIPSSGGGLDNILAAAANVAGKIDRLPLDSIGASLDATLRSAAGTMAGAQALVRRADQGLGPVMMRLPALVASLQETLSRAGRTLGTIDAGYGRESSFNRELERALVQVGDTARAVRLLADYLSRHPEALIRGRAEYGPAR